MTSQNDQRNDSARPTRNSPSAVVAMRSAMPGRFAAIVTAAVISAGTFAFGQDSVLLQDERNTIEVFRKSNPGVVHIEARAEAETKFEKKLIEAGTASGFFIDAEGHVLTNAHVIDGKNEIDVVLGAGRRLSARSTMSRTTISTWGRAPCAGSILR